MSVYGRAATAKSQQMFPVGHLLLANAVIQGAICSGAHCESNTGYHTQCLAPTNRIRAQSLDMPSRSSLFVFKLNVFGQQDTAIPKAVHIDQSPDQIYCKKLTGVDTLVVIVFEFRVGISAHLDAQDD